MAVRSSGRSAAGVAVAALAFAVLAACSSSLPAGSPPIPTFPGPGAAPTTSAPPPREGILPNECEPILSTEQLANLLGLSLGSLEVSALRDVPAPSAGRLERVTCTYTSLGGEGAPTENTEVLTLIASGYATPQDAAAQAQVNQGVEVKSGTQPAAVPMGAARAEYFDDPAGPFLVVVYGRVTASLTLDAGGPIPEDQAQPVLTDLALRILPVLVPQGSGS